MRNDGVLCDKVNGHSVVLVEGLPSGRLSSERELPLGERLVELSD